MTDLELAADPSTPPEILSRLAKETENDAVLGAVAGNPSTPADVLHYMLGLSRTFYSAASGNIAANPNAGVDTLGRLFRAHPIDVINNPAAMLHNITEPGLRWINPWDAKNVACREFSNKDVYWFLSTHWASSVRTELAQNEHIPFDLLVVLARDPDDEVRSKVAWNEQTTDEMLDELARDKHQFVRGSAKQVIENRRRP